MTTPAEARTCITEQFLQQCDTIERWIAEAVETHMQRIRDPAVRAENQDCFEWTPQCDGVPGDNVSFDNEAFAIPDSGLFTPDLKEPEPGSGPPLETNAHRASQLRVGSLWADIDDDGRLWVKYRAESDNDWRPVQWGDTDGDGVRYLRGGEGASFPASANPKPGDLFMLRKAKDGDVFRYSGMDWVAVPKGSSFPENPESGDLFEIAGNVFQYSRMDWVAVAVPEGSSFPENPESGDLFKFTHDLFELLKWMNGVWDNEPTAENGDFYKGEKTLYKRRAGVWIEPVSRFPLWIRLIMRGRGREKLTLGRNPKYRSLASVYCQIFELANSRTLRPDVVATEISRLYELPSPNMRRRYDRSCLRGLDFEAATIAEQGVERNSDWYVTLVEIPFSYYDD